MSMKITHKRTTTLEMPRERLKELLPLPWKEKGIIIGCSTWVDDEGKPTVRIEVELPEEK